MRMDRGYNNYHTLSYAEWSGTVYRQWKYCCKTFLRGVVGRKYTYCCTYKDA